MLCLNVLFDSTLVGAYIALNSDQRRPCRQGKNLNGIRKKYSGGRVWPVHRVGSQSIVH